MCATGQLVLYFVCGEFETAAKQRRVMVKHTLAAAFGHSNVDRPSNMYSTRILLSTQGFASASNRFAPVAAPPAAPDYSSWDGQAGTLRGDASRLGPGSYHMQASCHISSWQPAPPLHNCSMNHGQTTRCKRIHHGMATCRFFSCSPANVAGMINTACEAYDD
jgi:hypothetical protein